MHRVDKASRLQVYRKAVDAAWDAVVLNTPTATRLSAVEVLGQATLWDLQQVFSRGQDDDNSGLTAGFLDGPSHQRLVRGRNPRHRGVFLGRCV